MYFIIIITDTISITYTIIYFFSDLSIFFPFLLIYFVYIFISTWILVPLGSDTWNHFFSLPVLILFLLPILNFFFLLSTYPRTLTNAPLPKFLSLMSPKSLFFYFFYLFCLFDASPCETPPHPTFSASWRVY